MLSKIQNQFKSFLVISALLSATLPIAPAKSQIPQPLQTNFSQPEQLTQANLVAEDVKPSVIRVVVGCKAKVYSPNTGKIYDLEKITGHGSGFFVNPNGYAATNAHVTNPEDCQQILREDLATQLEADGQTLENIEAELKWIKDYNFIAKGNMPKHCKNFS